MKKCFSLSLTFSLQQNLCTIHCLSESIGWSWICVYSNCLHFKCEAWYAVLAKISDLWRLDLVLILECVIVLICCFDESKTWLISFIVTHSNVCKKLTHVNLWINRFLFKQNISGENIILSKPNFIHTLLPRSLNSVLVCSLLSDLQNTVIPCVSVAVIMHSSCPEY